VVIPQGRPPIIQTGTGNEYGQQQAQRIDQQMPLTPLDLLATIVPPLRPPISVVLTD